MGLAQGPLRECNLVRLFCARRSTVIFSKYSPELVRVGKRQKGRWLSMNVEEGDWGQRQNYSLQVRTLRMNHTHPTYFNVDWLDDCCSQFQGRCILQMPYRCPPGGEVGGNWRDLELAEPFINNNNTNNQWSEGFPVSSIKNRHQSINCPQPIPIDWLYRLTNNCFHIIQCYLTVLNGTQKKTKSSLQFTWSLLTTSSSLFGISGNSSLGMHSGLAADCI